jgi:hypothetical protein
LREEEARCKIKRNVLEVLTCMMQKGGRYTFLKREEKAV